MEQPTRIFECCHMRNNERGVLVTRVSAGAFDFHWKSFSMFWAWNFQNFCSIAMPAREFSHAMQILNHHDYSFLRNWLFLRPVNTEISAYHDWIVGLASPLVICNIDRESGPKAVVTCAILRVKKMVQSGPLGCAIHVVCRTEHHLQCKRQLAFSHCHTPGLKIDCALTWCKSN